LCQTVSFHLAVALSTGQLSPFLGVHEQDISGCQSKRPGTRSSRTKSMLWPPSRSPILTTGGLRSTTVLFSPMIWGDCSVQVRGLSSHFRERLGSPEALAPGLSKTLTIDVRKKVQMDPWIQPVHKHTVWANTMYPRSLCNDPHDPEAGCHTWSKHFRTKFPPA
jgi:hypothetical protein